MSRKRQKTTFPGVRYREHPTRRHGVKPDQYFFVRYKLDGKDKEEGLGWASSGWTAARAYERLSELKANQKQGQGPQSLKEKRVLAKAQREAEALEVEQAVKEAVTFADFMENTYLPKC
ncbi:MAG: hypothetical protein QMD09_13310, partial [Desulfatibacillaceae bacterium]|nr:hypothetical protein [Desulfatibacillaceae bacterium]